MALVLDYYKPKELTALSREIQADTDRPEATNYTMQTQFLPPSFQNDVEFRVKAGQSNIPHAASFRAWDAQNKIGAGVGFAEKTGGLVALGQKEVITEFDRLQLRKAEADLYRGELLKATGRATMATVVRMELAVAQTLLTGKTTLTNERGVTQEADWARNANRDIDAGFTWADPATSKPIVDMENVLELVDKAGTFYMSRTTRRMIGRSDSIRNLASVSIVGTPDTVTKTFVANVLADRDIEIAEYNAKYTDDAGAEQYILPLGKVLFIAGTPGRTVWGATRESMDPRYGLADSQWPGLAVGHYMSEDPIQDYVNVSAIGFPVLTLPDNTAVLNAVL